MKVLSMTSESFSKGFDDWLRDALWIEINPLRRVRAENCAVGIANAEYMQIAARVWTPSMTKKENRGGRLDIVYVMQRLERSNISATWATDGNRKTITKAKVFERHKHKRLSLSLR